MPVTQFDVAKRAKVSRSLVSRVLYGDPTFQVSEEKRERVLKVAKEMGYRPNATATNLRLGRTNSVVSISKFNPRNHALKMERGSVEVLAVELSLLGLELKLRPYASIGEVLAGIDELASMSLCDAVALWLPDDENEQAGLALERHGIPFVVVGDQEAKHPDWLQVDFDHKAMMRVCVEHLLSSGRKRIAYIGYENPGAYTRRLLDGFRSSAQELIESPVPDDWVIQVTETSDHCERWLENWLDLPIDQQPDGLVIGAGNKVWSRVERALAKRGRRTGMADGELAVTGQRFESEYLFYGHAMVFDSVQMSRISSSVAQLIGERLAPGGTAVNPIVRITPSLIEAGSLEMELPVRM